MPRRPIQHAPVKFGEPFNPKSVDGVRQVRRQRAEAQRWREMKAEREAAAEAGKPFLFRLWESLREPTYPADESRTRRASKGQNRPETNDLRNRDTGGRRR